MEQKRVVIKFGTKVLIDPTGEPRLEIIKQLAKTVSQFKTNNFEIILVMSGAIGFGIKSFNQVDSSTLTLEKKQAFAAIGQPLLMGLLKQCFDDFNLKIAQMLVTNSELNDRKSYLNLKNCLIEVLSLNAIPIINENDTVSTLELEEHDGKSFGDNDMLSSLVAIKLNAHKLILMTDTDGVYKDWGQKDQQLVRNIDNIVEFENNFSDKSKNEMGRGGMTSKIKAAKIASLCNIPVVIANGLKPETLDSILSEDDCDCTEIPPSNAIISSKRKWLGFSTGPIGRVFINEGAQTALEKKGASLLPVGITKIQGPFKKGDIVQIVDVNGFEVGRGLALYDSEVLDKFKGLNSSELAGASSNKKNEFIHRDNMVIFTNIIGYK